METRFLAFFFLVFLIFLIPCKSEFLLGDRISVQVPPEFEVGFKGRAFFMHRIGKFPHFKAGVSVEAGNGVYLCSLVVFLGDLIVWDSSRFSLFRPSESCVLELTQSGDLLLMDSGGRIGWRSMTSGQSVKKLYLKNTGNLVLTNGKNHVKWQSFDFPADILLWGQRLLESVPLISFSGDPSTFYSFEIQQHRAVLFLNSGRWKYSYWEFKPGQDMNISFAKVGSSGLNFFDRKSQKLGLMSSKNDEPIRFLALGKTGNLGLYQYSALTGKFESSFQALDSPCDLPLACGLYGMCTFSNSCSCMQVSPANRTDTGCDSTGFSGGFCSPGQSPELVPLDGFSTVLRSDPLWNNVSMEECKNLCLENCSCAAVMFSGGVTGIRPECFHYGFVGGVKQTEGEKGLTYLVKVSEGMLENCCRGSSENRDWLVILGGVIDGLAILLIAGGLLFYFFVVNKPRKDLEGGTT